MNVFGGIVNCATIARGIIGACKEIQLSLPLVVRLEGECSVWQLILGMIMLSLVAVASERRSYKLHLCLSLTSVAAGMVYWILCAVI